MNMNMNMTQTNQRLANYHVATSLRIAYEHFSLETKVGVLCFKKQGDKKLFKDKY